MRIIFFTFALVFLLVIVGGAFVLSQNPNQTASSPANYEYFWGDGCPHCAIVAEYFDSTDKDEKANIDKKEVWKNPANASLMAQRAKSCNIPPLEMGVPLLVTPESKCIGGDQPIIDFFKNLEI